MRAGEPQGDADEDTDAMLKGAATQRNSGMVPLDIEADMEAGRSDSWGDGGKKDAPSLRGDYGSIALLLLLYTLQGIPMGLSGALPMLLQERKVSAIAQATFSAVAYPFAFKLLWAPLVDSVYSATFGRRKTWIVPVQAAIGVLLIMSGPFVHRWLGPLPTQDVPASSDVVKLTALFFVFYFLAATQDIAVDGLALTVLSAANKELGATCNAIGQTFGYFIAYVGFIGLNAYELVTLGGFMALWGWVFVASTLWVLSVRRDEHTPLPEGKVSSMVDAYREMVLVVKLPAVLSLTAVLLTCKAPLSAFDTLIGLELQTIGVPKEHLAALATVMLPVGILAQAHVSKSFSGKDSRPMHIWLRAYKYRLGLGALLIGFVIVLRHATAGGAAIPTYMYVCGLLLMVVSSVVSSAMFVTQMAFFNRVSDPRIGGTYMTMLNTVANLGGQWPGTFVLAVKGFIEHTLHGLDAFTIVCTSATLLGVGWVLMFSARVNALQDKGLSDWKAP